MKRGLALCAVCWATLADVTLAAPPAQYSPDTPQRLRELRTREAIRDGDLSEQEARELRRQRNYGRQHHLPPRMLWRIDADSPPQQPADGRSPRRFWRDKQQEMNARNNWPGY